MVLFTLLLYFLFEYTVGYQGLPYRKWIHHDIEWYQANGPRPLRENQRFPLYSQNPREGIQGGTEVAHKSGLSFKFVLFTEGSLHIEDHPGFNRLLKKAPLSDNSLLFPVIWPVNKLPSVIVNDLFNRLKLLGFFPLLATSDSFPKQSLPTLLHSLAQYVNGTANIKIFAKSSTDDSQNSLHISSNAIEYERISENIFDELFPEEEIQSIYELQYPKFREILSRKVDDARMRARKAKSGRKKLNLEGDDHISEEPVFIERYQETFAPSQQLVHRYLSNNTESNEVRRLFQQHHDLILNYEVSGQDDLDREFLVMKGIYGEELAKQFLYDYIVLGDLQCSAKYFPLMLNYLSRSTKHSLSLIRLFPDYIQRKKPFSSSLDASAVMGEEKKYGEKAAKKLQLFEGEVMTVMLSYFLGKGFISPSLIYHARKNIKRLTSQSETAERKKQIGRSKSEVEGEDKGLSNSIPNLFQSSLSMFRPPTSCQLQKEIIRKQWHEFLSSRHSSLRLTSSWQYRFHRFRGFLVREASMTLSTSSQSATSSRPLLFCIHGFGGSIDQFTSLAQGLVKDVDVYALDCLGFGWSEKPTLTYNQYLWRDQVIEFIARVVKERVVDTSDRKLKVMIAGNSIGGYTATLAMAKLAQLIERANSSLPSSQYYEIWNHVEAAGLVLFNPSGEIVKEIGDSKIERKGRKERIRTAMLTSSSSMGVLFPEYRGIRSNFLQLSGKFLVSLLRPRIEPICKWLYPTNPNYVTESNLTSAILRDSLDPGASDVFASGAKLPPPLTLNTLLREYDGPVLLAQGILDPLNNATQRADDFEFIRGLSGKNVQVERLNLGHCPMDEDGRLVANKILNWSLYPDGVK